MKLIILWMILALCCFSGSELEVYVIPDSSNCTVNGTTILTPCYTLHQLINNSVLSSSSEATVKLFLLSGTHLIPKNQTLLAPNFSEVVIQPLNEERDVVIECLTQADIVFRDITRLKIYSLHFSSCSLTYNVTKFGNKHVKSVNLTECVFQGSKSYTIVIETGIYHLNITVLNCTFEFNYGAIRDHFNNSQIPNIKKEFTHVRITKTLFHGNGNIKNRGSFSMNRCILKVNECYFINNVGSIGGAIHSKGSSIEIENTKFHNNHASFSPLWLATSGVKIDNCSFVNNSGRDSIVAIYENYQSSPSFLNNSVFTENNARRGGALQLYNSGVTVSNCHFINNSAADGGAIYCFVFSDIYIKGGYSTLNSAERNGGFAYLENCQLSIQNKDYNVTNNWALNGGAIYASKSIIYNYGNKFTAVGNVAEELGGGLYLSESRTFNPYSTLVFENNAASKGGAIFASDINCETVLYHSQCFLQDYAEYKHQFTFWNNTAHQGSILYGGLLDRCFTSSSGTLGIGHFKNVSDYEATPLAITSDPVRVCVCKEDHQIDCTIRELRFSRMSGQTSNLIGTVVDQDSNPIQSFIRAGYVNSSAQLDIGEGRKETTNNCTNLSYHFFTSNASAVLLLRPEGYCENSNFSSVLVHIDILPCSRGFEINGNRCECDRRLTNFANITACNISTDSIQVKPSNWLRYDEKYLKVHANCPLDYCQYGYDTRRLAHPDEQCAHNRSGVLCGDCQENYSVALGGSKCLECTSSYTLIWLIPVFAVAGIGLVTLLLVCNVTVSHGTLNGLIFYANIVSISGLTNLQSCSIHPILSVFIAWINLDFGIETCFYSGMDTYQKIWLQFAFPLYIWILIGAIIIASHYSSCAVKVFGINNIAILATLFLLSYTKILKTIVTALNFTEVFRGSANDTSDQLLPYKVWTYDGNIEYLKGRHVPLFVVAMVLLVFLFLPYTLILILGQCIRSMRNSVFSSIRKNIAFISFMDAYHAPYNRKHHYWTGLMLLTRCILFLVFAFSYSEDRLLLNLLTTTIILVMILGLKVCIMTTYKSRYVNMLELIFLLNLAILSAALSYIRGHSKNDHSLCNCTSASISASMVIFVGILMYHIYLTIKKTKLFAKILRKRRYHLISVVGTDESSNIGGVQRLPTTTTVQVHQRPTSD